jgi:hypothetical protein
MHVVFWILSFIKKGYLSDFNLYAKMKRRENNILMRNYFGLDLDLDLDLGLMLPFSLYSIKPISLLSLFSS